MRYLVWLLAACAPAGARQMRLFYPSPGSDPATLVIQFTREVDNVHLSINGEPVASGVRTEQITVENIPAGEVAVMLAADGIEKAFGLKLEPGKHLVVPISAPAPPPAIHPLVQALLTIGVYAAYLGLAALL